MKDTPLPPAYKAGDKVLIEATVVYDIEDAFSGIEAVTESGDMYWVYPPDIVQPPQWQLLTPTCHPENGQAYCTATHKDWHKPGQPAELSSVMHFVINEEGFMWHNDAWIMKHGLLPLSALDRTQYKQAMYWMPLPPPPIKQ
jgi:hypothetical protein